MIPLGYEVGTGKRVAIPLNHMVILGQTQLSGKTTAMEAVALRGDVRAISFITKPGERSFRQRTSIPAFFSEASTEEYWKHVVAMLEYRSEVKLGWRERGVVIKLCQDYKKEGSRIGFDSKTGKSKRERMAYKWKVPKTLRDVLTNLESYLPYARSAEEMICIQLREFLRPVISEIEKTQFSDKLQLARGINVMDVTELSDGLKSLVIRSVIEWVHKHGRKIVVIIPEAWKFIPEGRSTPVKLALEGLIREGAGVGNFVWMDSQDLRGVDKLLLRSVIVWLFGVQRQKNEVASTLASIPDHPKPSASEIMQLDKGQFYVCYGTTLVRTYVQPAGMEDEHAKAIALGDEKPESWTSIVRGLDAGSGPEPEGYRDGAGADPRDRGAELDPDGLSTPQDHGNPAGTAVDSALGQSRDPQNGRSGRSVEGSQTGVDEDMWKEKYEALRAEFDDLKSAHDLLAARLAELDKSSRPGRDPGVTAQNEENAAGRQASLPAAGSYGKYLPEHFRNGDLEAIYRYIVDRAAKEAPASLLRVVQERPELRVEIQRKTIEANGSTLRGALGILISEKYFDNAREFADVRKDLIRRGFLESKAPNLQISQALQGLVESGFLTKESQGYQAVAGMKVHIRESAV